MKASKSFVLLTGFLFFSFLAVLKPAFSEANCFPSTQADLRQCKNDCVKTAPTYDKCLSNCETWYRNCNRKPGESAEIPRM